MGRRRHPALLLVLLTFHLLEDVFPGRLMFVGHRLHERFDEIFGGLHPKDG